ncbi:MAG: polysaccharide biosynthesis protein [Sandaracinaceae bacterium]|nr:polysaccharide biosynthesis protein [Sandaracinaceae bacterium]
MSLARFARGASIYAAAGLALKALSLIIAPIYTRFLAVEEFGAINLAESFSAILAAVVSLSLPQALNRIYFKHEEREPRERFVSSVLWGGGAVTVAVLAMSFAVGPFTTALVSRWFPSLTFYPVLALALGAALATQYLQIWQRLFQAEETPRPFAVTRLMQGILTSAAVLALVVGLEAGGVGLLVGRLVGVLAVVAWVHWVFRRRMAPKPALEDLRAAVRFGVPLIPFQITVLVLEVSDRFVIEATLGTERVGVYSLAAMLGGVMIFVNRSVVAAWHPVFYRHVETPEGRERIGRDAVRVLSVTAAVAAFGAVIADDFVSIVFDARYAEAGALVPWIIGGYLVWEVFALTNLQTHAKERPGVSSAIAVLSGIVNVGLNVWLVPRHGIVAAAITTFAAYSLQAVVGAIVAHRIQPIPYAWSRGGVVLAVFGAVLAVTQIEWASPAHAWVARGVASFAALALAAVAVRGSR